jgi:hypothetical protein
MAASPSDVPAQTEAYFEPKPQIHTEAEVMAALQALIPPGRRGPATVATDVVRLEALDPAPMPAVEPVAATAEPVPALPGSQNTRWIAEAAPVSPEEAALSLEKEMEKAYAAFAACEAAQAVAALAVAIADPVAPLEPETAAITNRHPLGEPDPVKIAASLEQLAASSGASQGGEAASATQRVAFQALEPPPAAEQEKVPEPEPQVSVAEPGLSPGSAPAAISEPIAPPVEAFAAPAEPEIEMAGGIDEMGKKDWADFRSMKGTGTSKLAKATSKESEPEESVKPEPEPAAMAAAASASGSSATAPDPRAIANIVDSVLAELRPKIVEEIAKKLADPKKE